ncbi:PREDICTED: cyclin-D2-1-like isoform X2 [Nicotiana attenuata]|uniref:cyclin-D2-1-like isoform X2 n=1 Tax=Nicotiana attenuata TaxID=49451 RepID=UPI000905A9DA|nr:PREDICTED: cyclin-D2-1-like isoform X2 [Nicotiana attenuata]
MAPSMDCAVSSLLCAEDNNSIFYNEDYDDVGFVEEDRWYSRNHRNGQENNKRLFYGEESLTGIPLQSEECLALMIEKECEHMPAVDYLDRLRNGDLDIGARDEILDWIAKVHSHFSFGPMCAYLAVNYFDRFLSAYDLPKGKAWMMQLLGVACLSLAAKMEETDVPLSLDLQVEDAKFVFEARTIQRMELLVLSTLKWRMQAITPFSFIDYFLKKINDDQIATTSLINKSVQLLLSTLKGIHLLEYKPSEIAAAAVAISVAVKTETIDSEKAVSALVQHVQKDKVMKCVELIQELVCFIKGPNASSIPQSPIGVLDAACLSYTSDESRVGSCANSSHTSPPIAKRRKLNDTKMDEY